MSHDAIENMPSEPPTPTISSVGSELSFEDVASGSPIVGGPKEHPELFLSDNMVTIQVEETLFRIPAYFLTQDSAHFAGFLENKDAGFMVHVTDDDVSSTAFANLLVVLRPRLGVTPISTLSEWTDVLHLSTKWGFEHFRTAAITAILPLASAVDKLVLGRTYGFVDWVPGAYTDLLKREDDLTLNEARKMALEDVVAIAKGRRESRTQRIKPDAVIDEIVQSLLPVKAPRAPASGPTSEAAAPPVVSATVVHVVPPQPSRMDSVSTDDQARISRWLDQMTTPSSRTVAQECLVKFMQEDRTRVPLVLDMVLERGFKEVNNRMDAKGHLRNGSSSGGWDGTADGQRYYDLYNIHCRDTTLGLIRSKQTEDACLRLVNHWSALADLDFNRCTDDLITTPAWKSITRATTYLAYLHSVMGSSSYSIVDPSVYSDFWIVFANLYRSTPCNHQVALARCTKTLLAELGQYTSKLAVCKEMDGFYQAVEEMRNAAQAQAQDKHRELIPLLNDIIGSRIWTSE